jgi:primosomal protein N' (replication factor Y)
VALVAADGEVIIGADAGHGRQGPSAPAPGPVPARRELADRQELGFPPITRMASLTGTPSDVAELLSLARLDDDVEELGSVPVNSPARPARGSGSGSDSEWSSQEQIRLLLRAPRPSGVRLAEALHAAAAVRSARKSGGPVRLQLDPLELF